MAGFDRKVKRSQAKAKNKKQPKDIREKWDDLVPLARDCQLAYLSLFSKLVETEKQFFEVIKKEPKLEQAIRGLSKTYSELGEKLASNLERHTVETGKVDKDGKPMKEFLSGVIELDDPAYTDYREIYNGYMEILTYIPTTGMDLFTALFADIQALSNAITKEDVEMISNAVEQGKDKILNTIQKGAEDVVGNKQ